MPNTNRYSIVTAGYPVVSTYDDVTIGGSVVQPEALTYVVSTVDQVTVSYKFIATWTAQAEKPVKKSRFDLMDVDGEDPTE